MPYRVSFDIDNRIVNVVVSGAATINDHQAARDESIRLFQQNDCSRLLVDLRELDTTLLSTVECFDFADSFARLFPHIQIAQVIPTEAKSREDSKFMNTVAVNRGLLAREFETVEEARKWLLEET